MPHEIFKSKRRAISAAIRCCISSCDEYAVYKVKSGYIVDRLIVGRKFEFLSVP